MSNERPNVSFPRADAIRRGSVDATGGLRSTAVDGGKIVVDAGGFSRDASPRTRDAILKSLYEERSLLLRQRREGGPNSAQAAAALVDLEAYIDRWQVEADPSRSASVWSNLESIGAQLLEVRAEVERRRK